MLTQSQMQTEINKRLNEVIYEAQAEWDHLCLQTALNALDDAKTDAPHEMNRALVECHGAHDPIPETYDDALGAKIGREEAYRRQMIDAGRGHLLGD